MICVNLNSRKLLQPPPPRHPGTRRQEVIECHSVSNANCSIGCIQPFSETLSNFLWNLATHRGLYHCILSDGAEEEEEDASFVRTSRIHLSYVVCRLVVVLQPAVVDCEEEAIYVVIYMRYFWRERKFLHCR